MPPTPPRCPAPLALACPPQFHQPCHFATDHFVGKTTDVTPPSQKGQATPLVLLEYMLISTLSAVTKHKFLDTED